MTTPNNKVIISSIITLSLLIITLFISTWYLANSYKTQTILFRNKADKLLQIEFQMKDIGTFGYNKRIVKVRKKIFFNTTEVIDIKSIDSTKWEEVNEPINELGLKGG